jgi:hypothetical protein
MALMIGGPSVTLSSRIDDNIRCFPRSAASVAGLCCVSNLRLIIDPCGSGNGKGDARHACC